MSAGRLTLQRYIGARFLTWIALLFAISFFLVLLIDFLELVRRAGDKPNFTLQGTFLMSAFGIPSIIEQTIPFVVLIGSIAAFRSLSQNLELVVARAAGVSVWQFCAPALVIMALLGLASALLFNPLSAELKRQSDQLGIEIFGLEQRILLQTSESTWLRQNGRDGESVLHANQSLDQGRRIFGVTIFTFDKDGHFDTRIEAQSGELFEGQWHLANGHIFTSDGRPQPFKAYRVSTLLSPEQIGASFAAPDAVPFWSLSGVIDKSLKAGLSAYPYRMQFHTLVALPILLCAMVLIAAVVSLRIGRFGGAIPMILGGIAAGFVLYVITKIAEDLGGAGIVPPFVAAWSPGLAAALIGFSILLFQEDG
jgi:lipopolysaccharide export system permease protein